MNEEESKSHKQICHSFASSIPCIEYKSMFIVYRLDRRNILVFHSILHASFPAAALFSWIRLHLST